MNSNLHDDKEAEKQAELDKQLFNAAREGEDEVMSSTFAGAKPDAHREDHGSSALISASEGGHLSVWMCYWRTVPMSIYKITSVIAVSSCEQIRSHRDRGEIARTPSSRQHSGFTRCE